MQVYQDARAFNRAIRGSLASIPKWDGVWTMNAPLGAPVGMSNTDRRQLRDAALSIVLNIAEGQGRTTPGDRRHFATIARGSLYEVVSCLTILQDDGVLDPAQVAAFRAQAAALLGQINGLIARPGGTPAAPRETSAAKPHKTRAAPLRETRGTR